MRKVLLEWLPASVRASLREWRDLPRTARFAWTRLMWQRLLGRDLTELPPDLAPMPRVLFVCHGNIYRSPAAEAAFADEARRRGFPIGSVASAGLRASTGRPAPDDAISAASAIGVDLGEHRSTLLSSGILAESDLIVIMDRRNQALLASISEDALQRAVLLGAFDLEMGKLNPVIADPYGRGRQSIEDCYARIQRSVHGLLDALAAGGLPTSSEARLPTQTRAKHALQRTLTQAPWLSLWSPIRREAASVLMLHRFAQPDIGISGHCAAQLATNLEFLRKHRFNICSLQELTERLEQGMAPEPNTIVFTVDDGYADFAAVGAPVFAAYDVPATVFLITSCVDERTWVWYDVLRYCAARHLVASVEVDVGSERVTLTWRNSSERRRAIRNLIARLHQCPTGVAENVVASFPTLMATALPSHPTARFASMNWDDIAHWEKRGMQFGPHTHRHPILSRSTSERAREEIETSWRHIRQRTSRPVSTFCFPRGMPGDFTARDQSLAQAAGLRAAVSAHGGRVRAAQKMTSMFAVPRLAYNAMPASFQWQVGGWGSRSTGAAE